MSPRHTPPKILLSLMALNLAAGLWVGMSPPAQSANWDAFETATGSPPPISVNEVKLFLNRVERMTNHKALLAKYYDLSPQGVVIERIGNQFTYYDRSTFDDKLKADYKDLRKVQYRISVESVNVNGNRAYFRATVYQKGIYPDYELIRKQEWEAQKEAEAAAGGGTPGLPAAASVSGKPKKVFIKNPTREIAEVYREMGTVEKVNGKLKFLLYSAERLKGPDSGTTDSNGSGGVDPLLGSS